MKTEWTEVHLEDIATIVGRGITPKYSDDGDYTVINQRCVRGGRVTLAQARRHDSSAKKVRADKVLLVGDVLVNSTGVGTLGRTAPVPTTQELLTADSHLTIVRPNQNVNPRWLAYALSAAESEIEGMAEGSTGQTELSRHRLALLSLDLPPLDVQCAIAATLGALDDKIESNRQIISIIPQVIRSYVNSALEDGQESIAVRSLARYINGGAYTKGATGTGRMVVRIAELNSGPGGSTVYNEIEVPEDKTARAGDLLMSWSGSLGIYRWFRDEAIINQHIFKVVPTGYPAWLVYDRLEAVMPVFRAIAADKATTMGHIKRSHLDDTRVDIPTSASISSLDGRLALLWHRLLYAERENLRLQKLRDTLIPELLSGRIRASVKES